MTVSQTYSWKSIVFIDIEVDPQKGIILDYGGIKHSNQNYHGSSSTSFIEFIKGSEFVCGHNIFKHDLKYIKESIHKAQISADNIIDTLYLSPLMFPTKPYHNLVKDDKLQSDQMNNPLNDSLKAKDLFEDEVAAFSRKDETLKKIFYLLLKDTTHFSAFFKYIQYKTDQETVITLIQNYFRNSICEKANIQSYIEFNPVELSYCLSLIDSYTKYENIHSITPPWVLKNFPTVENIMYILRSKPCEEGCQYCNHHLDAKRGLKKFFGYDSFRTYGGEPLQENAVNAAILQKSILAVFPTGGGKSITFQVPALMQGDASRALTVVISPLQSLMKDQVDNLEKQGITTAVTINGLLDPIDRAKSIERVADGSACLLYISPESLRSKTIETLIMGRQIARFVIDEAHCFSSWGQDFRVDYLYIGDFIKKIQVLKNLPEPIPVSCLTATAKQKVIEDIVLYFQNKLSIDLIKFTSKVSRTNLHYKVYFKKDEEEKYVGVRELLEQNVCPTIIYVSRTKKAKELAERLNKDGFNARHYHGKLEKQEKTANQNAFISGETQIMVATSAFGMGVDKKDVGMVIHYEISDSLENYVQEAGRAGRDEKIEADCYVLFNEDDLSKHFILLNQTKLSIKEIQQIWKAIKDLTKYRNTVSNSALEIARKAGWDDQVREIETRVTTAIAALEEAGYLKRGMNTPKVFATSINSQNAQSAIDQINHSNITDKENAIRIIKKLFSSKTRQESSEEQPESRIDYISDQLGMSEKKVIQIISELRQIGILADAKDLTAFIKKGDQLKNSIHVLESFAKLESFLLPKIDYESKEFHLKILNEEAEKNGVSQVSVNKIKTVLNIWSIKNWIQRKALGAKNYFSLVALKDPDELYQKLTIRHALAKFIIEYLYKKTPLQKESNLKEEYIIQFSVKELQSAYLNSADLYKLDVSLYDVEDCLFYLSRMEALKIEGGFLVVHNKLNIQKLIDNNKKQYTKDDYEKLNEFYNNKVQQIHIVGEYANKMIQDYREALQFVDDYFQLNYSSFLRKYFKGDKETVITRNVTPSKFKQLFGELSPVQNKIIRDREHKNIVVTAGPGSGKTKLLVHKLASLLLMEDVKHEQLLMLTFSRAAASEFKNRLRQLIGNAASFIEIKTFHSYCFDLLGKMGSLQESKDVIKRSVEKIREQEVEISLITKTVLVLDEAQDMNEDEFALVQALMDVNEEMTVIAVGDDDQNIYEFRGSDSKYLEEFISQKGSVKYELVENYRSKSNIVLFANQVAQKITKRLKEAPNYAHQKEDGVIQMIQYKNKNIEIPLVTQIGNTDLKGSTAVLTVSNDKAFQVTGLLLNAGLKAKLIQSNDQFNLMNLEEIRYFYDQIQLEDHVFSIDDDLWIKAKKAFYQKYKYSSKVDICIELIKQFQNQYPKTKYKSDLEAFIKESKLEDFYLLDNDTIFVSTIHKAKGKEFDNLFVLLDHFELKSDKEIRLLYVALTRAKNNLYIHKNTSVLDDIKHPSIDRKIDQRNFDEPKIFSVHLTHRDIWLGFFEKRQSLIEQLKSGDKLEIDEKGCYHAKQQILAFSKSFLRLIEEKKSLGYIIKSANINFIVYWKQEDSDREIKIILPEIGFEKRSI